MDHKLDGACGRAHASGYASPTLTTHGGAVELTSGCSCSRAECTGFAVSLPPPDDDQPFPDPLPPEKG